MSEEDDFAPPPARGRGRPRKGEAPVIDYEQLDKLLVYGELTPAKDARGHVFARSSALKTRWWRRAPRRSS